MNDTHNQLIVEQLKRIADNLEEFTIALKALIINYELKKEEIEIQQEEKIIHEDVNTKTIETITEDLKLKYMTVEFETPKAYKVRRDDKLFAWIPKKAVISKLLDDDDYGELTIAHWFKEKVKWQEE